MTKQKIKKIIAKIGIMPSHDTTRIAVSIQQLRNRLVKFKTKKELPPSIEDIAEVLTNMGYVFDDSNNPLVLFSSDKWKLEKPNDFLEWLFNVNTLYHSRLIRYLKTDQHLDRKNYSIQYGIDYIRSGMNPGGYFGDKEVYITQLLGLYSLYIDGCSPPQEQIKESAYKLLKLEEQAEGYNVKLVDIALTTIHNEKLYEEFGYSSWEEYCVGRWDCNDGFNKLLSASGKMKKEIVSNE